ncbi:MAG: addiction module toxin RelE [Methylobacterium sp.]|nr:MAG: addiction module toxin RelE [Methylobacterium sp.]
MPRLVLSRQAARFLEALPTKQARQIAEKIAALAENPDAPASEPLRGYAPMRRLKAGEFRIVFVVEQDVLEIRLIGKRNDDEIYKALARALRK